MVWLPVTIELLFLWGLMAPVQGHPVFLWEGARGAAGCVLVLGPTEASSP